MEKTKKTRSVQMDSADWAAVDSIANELDYSAGQLIRKWVREKLKEYEAEKEKNEKPI